MNCEIEIKDLLHLIDSDQTAITELGKEVQEIKKNLAKKITELADITELMNVDDLMKIKGKLSVDVNCSRIDNHATLVKTKILLLDKIVVSEDSRVIYDNV